MLRRRYFLGAPMLAAAVTVGAIVAPTASSGKAEQPTAALAEARTPEGPAEEIQTGTELSLAEVREIAAREAARAQRGPQGNSVRMSVARGEAGVALAALAGAPPATAAAATTAVPQDAGRTIPPGATPRQVSEPPPAMHKPVFAVVMQGDFEVRGIPEPPGQGPGRGRVLTLTIDAHTGFVEAIAIDEVAPNLEALGPMVPLEEGEETQKEEAVVAAPNVEAQEPILPLEEAEKRQKEEAARARAE